MKLELFKQIVDEAIEKYPDHRMLIGYITEATIQEAEADKPINAVYHYVDGLSRIRELTGDFGIGSNWGMRK